MKNEPQATPAAISYKSVKEIEANAKSRMDKALADLQHDMAGVRTGRASVSLLDNVRADYYGTPTPLNQLSTLHVPEPSLITVQPWDVSQIGAIEKATASAARVATARIRVTCCAARSAARAGSRSF